MNTFQRIDFLRKSKGITLKFLNESIPNGYRGKLTELKNGKTTLSVSDLECLTRLLDTSIDYLLGKTDDPAPSGQTEKPTSSLEDGLSAEAKELIRLFDLASPEIRSAALAVLKSAEAAGKVQDAGAKGK